jgi:3-oxoacyl-[acyl-carrier-protein] synthase-1
MSQGLTRPMPPLAIRAHTATTALGRGLAAQRQALAQRRSGLRRNDFGPHAENGQPLDCWIGRVDGLETEALPAAFAQWECRNNRLAWLALQQDGLLDAVTALRLKHGAERVALVLGTSTSSIGATEEAYARLQLDAHGQARFPADLMRPIVHTPHSLGDFVQQATRLRGPCVTVATACSSSAKVFAQAARLIGAGLADAALVGGVDTLCGSVLFGFNALQLVSAQPCRPFDAARNGLSLGEAGGFAVLERADAGDDGLQLRGYGESSDAHHMSTPHPEGLGAQLAMRAALARAGIDPGAVGYLNLHGTATPANDSIEAAAVAALFPTSLHAGSTKGWTGHTLGAAGIVESVFALLALEHGVLPGTLNSSTPDAACGPQIRFDNAERDIAYAMNNSFGFGGNNCSLVFSTGVSAA